MKVTRILVSLFLLAGVTSVASAQVGQVYLFWDVCAPGGAASVNKDFVGPVIYKQVVSVLGAEEISQGWEVSISIGAGGAGYPDAWRFDALPLGCNGGQLSATSAALSKACPALEGGRPLFLTQFAYDAGTDKALLQMFNAYDPFDPVATTPYTLAQLNYNHAFSVVGPADPAQACGHAERPMCFHIVRSGYLNAQNTVVPLPVGQEFVTWQDPANTLRCPGATASVPSTWGQIKNVYR
jgi:hypothetical protein